MRKLLALTGLVLALVAFVSSPSAAVDYHGLLLDGHTLPATIYGPFGPAPGVVYFQQDQARMLMLDGELLYITLYKRTIDDYHFVTGKSGMGDFYRIDLEDGAWQHSSVNDPFFMPVGTIYQAPPIAPSMSRGGGRHGGGS